MAQSPPLLAGTLGAAVGLPAFAWWRGRFGGYAGQPPDQALAVLQQEDALLIDIRCCSPAPCCNVPGTPGTAGKWVP